MVDDSKNGKTKMIETRSWRGCPLYDGHGRLKPSGPWLLCFHDELSLSSNRATELIQDEAGDRKQLAERKTR